MSAETLRRAAALMRERAEEPVAQPDRWAQVVAPALADCLDDYATKCDRMSVKPGPHALRVARAYLGEPA